MPGFRQRASVRSWSAAMASCGSVGVGVIKVKGRKGEIKRAGVG